MGTGSVPQREHLDDDDDGAGGADFPVFQTMLIVPNTIRPDLMVPTAELPRPPTYSDVIYDPKDQTE